jgi:hypothetical protein
MPLPERSYIADPALSLEDPYNFPILHHRTNNIWYT